MDITKETEVNETGECIQNNKKGNVEMTIL